MNEEKERLQVMLTSMEIAIQSFYYTAVKIGNHPFIEFAGVMTAYLNSCQRAMQNGIDFTQCNVHTGQRLPMESFEVDYLNEKLECIFTGHIAAKDEPESSTDYKKLGKAQLIEPGVAPGFASWIADSDKPNVESGVATFSVDGKAIDVQMASFSEFHALSRLVDQYAKYIADKAARLIAERVMRALPSSLIE